MQLLMASLSALAVYLCCAPLVVTVSIGRITTYLPPICKTDCPDPNTIYCQAVLKAMVQIPLAALPPNPRNPGTASLATQTGDGAYYEANFHWNERTIGIDAARTDELIMFTFDYGEAAGIVRYLLQKDDGTCTHSMPDGVTAATVSAAIYRNPFAR